MVGCAAFGGAATRIQALKTDRAASVIGYAQCRVRFSPFGISAPAHAGIRSGYNGQWREGGGGYLPGNGRRLYLPALMRFAQPDALSPFGEGGLNTYGWCQGDPVNAIDPSGRSPIWLLSNILGTLALTGYGGMMAAGYRLARPARIKLAVDIALMTAGTAAQAVSWATRDDVVQTVNLAATGVTVLGRFALFGHALRLLRKPRRLTEVQMIGYRNAGMP